MRTTIQTVICITGRFVPIFGVVLLIGVLVACASEEPDGPRIQAQDVWSRPAKEGMSNQSTENKTEMQQSMTTSAVYMKLVNKSDQADRLVRASADVAETVEIHESRMEGEVMKMQHLADGLAIPAEGEVELKPGGYHVMLIGLKSDLQVGDRFPVVLTFEKGETLTVEAEVRAP